MTLFSLIALLVARMAHGDIVDPVHVNQVGYAPADRKWVAIGRLAASFTIHRVTDDAVVLSGSVALRRAGDPASGDDVYAGEFSNLTTPGDYYVRVPGAGRSPRFTIDTDVYTDLYRAFLKGLYYQRCGVAIGAEYGHDWTHGACHASGSSRASYAWDLSGEYRNTIGGWHDAGDYGKYSTNNAYSVGVLLEAYEQFPDRFMLDDCGIPESGNGTPDLLDEARWALQWMLKMQTPSGAVIHRESIAEYAGIFAPEVDPVTRYFTSTSSDATAMHAAAMARAARVFRGFDRPFATACSTSAVGAWEWLLAHPSREPPGGFVNEYGHTGSTYNLVREAGGRLWAAAEVHRLNGSAAAGSYVAAHWGEGLDSDGVWYPDGWSDPTNLAAFCHRDAPGANPAVVSGHWWSIENSTLASASGWASRVAMDGYGCVASTEGPVGDYFWGSNGVILRYAWTMIEAFRYSGNAEYVELAREQLHYVLGRNPMGKCYVTGVGSRPVLHAHGAWNLAAGYVDVADALCRPVPFQLVGGANREDNGALSPYPARCYEDIADPNYDDTGNYTLNEMDINTQAALIALTGYLRFGDSVAQVPEPLPSLPTVTASPNPFRSHTAIAWQATGSRPGSDFPVRAVDVTGRVVARLNGRVDDRSAARIVWDGMTVSGARARPGVYFVIPPRPAPALKIVLTGS